MTSISGISSYSTYSATSMQQQLYAKMNTDGNEGISQEEFVAARPDDVSEENAIALFEELDTSESGSLSESDLAQMGGAPPPPPGPPPEEESDENEAISSLSSSGIDLDSLFTAMDTDESGAISEDAATTATSSSDETTSASLIQDLLKAISSYKDTAGYGSSSSASDELTSTLMEMV